MPLTVIVDGKRTLAGDEDVDSHHVKIIPPLDTGECPFDWLHRVELDMTVHEQTPNGNREAVTVTIRLTGTVNGAVTMTVQRSPDGTIVIPPTGLEHDPSCPIGERGRS